MSYNIPTNIATGENGDLNVLEKQELEINVTSAIMTFMSYSIKSSTIYAEHSNRKIIIPEDIKRAMMVEVFVYFDRPDLIVKTAEWRQILIEDTNNGMSDDESDDEGDECSDEDKTEEEFIIEDKKNEVKCGCEICSQMSDIVDKWQYYEPKDELGKIFKKHIDLII